MPDDKTKVGEPDRSRVSADQDYEVRQLAEKHGLSPTQIRELIARVGYDREKLRGSRQATSRPAHLRLSLPMRLDRACLFGGCCLKCGERGSGNSDAAANEQHRR